MVEKILVQEYLESLKEDQELDYIFTLLLNSMEFRVVKTPRESKGQSQYGKDTIAIGPDSNGVIHRWYFEIKGYDDRDIDQRTFMKDDGLKDSLLEAKYAKFNARGIPGFNKLPRKVVLVHNGVTKENFRPTFEGFIEDEFGDNGFEDWDINRLTDLFSQYLFSEYLLADPVSVRLLKRVLVFLDVPEYQLADLKPLLDRIIQVIDLNLSAIKPTNKKSRQRLVEKLMASLNILALLLFHYSREVNNLYPAKQGLTQITLRAWHFILKHKLELNQTYLSSFNRLLSIQYQVLRAFYGKTLPIASSQHGLFTSEGFAFEAIGYPLRCFEYLNDLLYYFRLNNAFASSEEDIAGNKTLQKDVVKQLITNNNGCSRPLLDGHSITIFHLIKFFLESDITQEDAQFLSHYLIDCLENIIIRRQTKNTFPMLGYNLEKLSDFEIENKKPYGYFDSSSLLIPFLFEMVTLFKLSSIYSEMRPHFLEEPNLQTAYLNNEIEIEELLFMQDLDKHYWVETDISLPKEIDEFRQTIIQKIKHETSYRTDTAGYGLLRQLAQIYYGNEPHPDEWRLWFLSQD